MRLIVTGSRNLYPKKEAGLILARLAMQTWPKTIRIVHGCCPVLRSVDWAFDEEALSLGLEVEQWHPEQFGTWPGCGPRRNSAMVTSGADLGIAYHDKLRESRGTLDCVRKMIQSKIPVMWFCGNNQRIRLKSLVDLDRATEQAIPAAWMIELIGGD